MRIALDDFGTGYSSLSYLHKLPLDKIKIDRSFLMDVTQNPRSLELLKGIVNLSRPLGLTRHRRRRRDLRAAQDPGARGEAGPRPGLPVRLRAQSASGIETMSDTVWPFAEDINSAETRDDADLAVIAMLFRTRSQHLD